jgi:DNA mismatch repair protein MutS
VPNDVNLSENGILLTGYNGIGKTSLIRALGVAVVMAQAGFYVPCTAFSYRPYRSMFCHIEKNDNLFRHLSTFQLEMGELRVVMQYADRHSLVLGDEWMNSTEIQSGLTIMMSALDALCTQGASFVVATHFNQLADYDEVRALVKADCLQLKHLAVAYDGQGLVYDRRLKDGLGTRSYGLEVARSLHMDAAFLERAFALRNKYFPEGRGILSTPTSRYSTQKLRGTCEQCGQAMSTETHHRMPQCDADADGFIGHMHKHHPANLLAVCERCHLKLHHAE